MTAIVFLGPSLALETARAALGAVYLPPAGHGDIYRATLRRPKPRAIGLIDGYFRHRPAVRHKEILWAMSQGIHVFGAASIGALRAAELGDFGMRGIGRVFADFRDGRLEDDDEVAVDHGPAELGYPPVNEAMVDIRATLEEARHRCVIGEACTALLLDLAKQRFYAERAYPELLAAAAEQGAVPAELDALRAWLPAGRVCRKRDDVLALLAALRDFLASDVPPQVVTYRFEHTETWDADTAFSAPLEADREPDTALRREHLLDEFRLAGDPTLQSPIGALRAHALAMALSRREAERSRVVLTTTEVEAFRRRWLAERGLGDPAALAEWCWRNHLAGPAFAEFIAARAREVRIAEMARDLVDEHLADALRLSGRYAEMAARALAKQRALEAAGAATLPLAESAFSALDLLAWFCGGRLRVPLPTDVERFASECGFRDGEALYRALLREGLYLQLIDQLSDGSDFPQI